MGFGLTDGIGAEMKDRGGQNRAGVAFRHPLDKVIQRANPARGDDWNRDCIGNRAGQRQVIAALGAVAVHRGEQDFSRTLGRDCAGELHRINASGFAPAMGENLPFSGANCFGVNRHDDALRAEPIRRLGHHIGVGDGG